ncbi:aminotransferase class IV [Chitinophaga nivalis]|uniref:Aminotransferase class IV n=1 Tax=Chitinophaga nivalis TaxID=2991709 RepID=A0ABT3IFK3_9BACT|nr:aminotransferase class IV [Chitinophaga nivalis]MCW3467617.1 aminotransferase class IV [Chitinophaga nivalis]MCW3482691.1 aminotransferase class IV [Chitinophaga nivalis]
MLRQYINGQPVTTAAHQLLLSLNNGHFTAIQARNARIKGWDLHQERLRTASRFLFGCAPDIAPVTAHLRLLLDEYPDCALRVNIFATPADLKQISADDLQILITQSTPVEMSHQPIRVSTTPYERFLPHIKHAGIAVALLHHKRNARLRGFDDVLYTDVAGNISEGSIWNIGFHDGDTFVFPYTPALEGITLQLLRRTLQQAGIPVQTTRVHLQDLPRFRAAFILNSITVGQPIAQIDQVNFSNDNSVLMQLRDAYQQIPWERP